MLQQRRNARGLKDDPPAGIVGASAKLAPFRLEAAQPGQRDRGVGIGGNIVPDFNIIAAMRAIRDPLRWSASLVDDDFRRRDMDIVVLSVAGGSSLADCVFVQPSSDHSQWRLPSRARP